MKLFSAVLLATVIAALITAAIDPGFDPVRMLPAPSAFALDAGSDDEIEWSGAGSRADGEGFPDLGRAVWFVVGFAGFFVLAPRHRPRRPAR